MDWRGFELHPEVPEGGAELAEILPSGLVAEVGGLKYHFITAGQALVHGDLHTANTIVDAGSITAVIDFGDITGADPAVDFAIAWMLFGEADRRVFRAAAGVQLAVDDEPQELEPVDGAEQPGDRVVNIVNPALGINRHHAVDHRLQDRALATDTRLQAAHEHRGVALLRASDQVEQHDADQQQHPDQRTALRSEPSAIPDAFNEILRYDMPTQLLCRTITRDYLHALVERGGMDSAAIEQMIPQGDDRIRMRTDNQHLVR